MSSEFDGLIKEAREQASYMAGHEAAAGELIERLADALEISVQENADREQMEATLNAGLEKATAQRDKWRTAVITTQNERDTLARRLAKVLGSGDE